MIELDIHLIPWEGGKCPIEEGQAVLIQERSGNIRVVYQHDSFSDAWEHTYIDNPMFHIIAYLPVNITVKEFGDARD